MMAIELAFAEPGKMLAAAETPGRPQAGEKLASVCNRFPWIPRDGTRAHYFARSFAGQVKDRGKIDVKSESAAVFSNELSVLAEEFAVAGGEYILCRRCGTQDVSKPVYVAAFEIDTDEQRRRDARLTIAEESPGLLGALNVSSEQDDSGRLYAGEKGTELRC